MHRLAAPEQSPHHAGGPARGRVRADSDFPPGPLPAIENHAGRPEVRAALAGAPGVATRRSETVGRQLHVRRGPRGARRRPGRGGPGAGGRDRARAQRAVAGAALLALLVGTVLALVAGRSIARPLTEIAAAARAIAAGSPPRFPRSGIPEIDALVQALRQMHRQLGDRFDELRREQAESAALVESMIEGVIAADGRGHIVTANPAARRLLGYEPAEPLPRPRRAVPGEGRARGGGRRAAGPAGAGPAARDGRPRRFW